MDRKSVISLFLLSLLLAAHTHNAFAHSHFELGGRGETDAHLSVHHDHGHHHHHGDDQWVLLGWIAQLFGDLEHAEQGENHLEVFLNPKPAVGLNQVTPVNRLFHFIPASIYLLLPFPAAPDTEEVIPFGWLCFSDPPFSEAVPSRGPPSFS